MSKQDNTPKFIDTESRDPLVKNTQGNKYILEEGTLLEPSPQELLEIAKHFSKAETNPSEAIEKAYHLIYEAHYQAQCLKLFNDKTRNDYEPVPKQYKEIIEESKNEKGHIVVITLLQNFFKEFFNKENSTAVKDFNKWLKWQIRYDAYSSLAENMKVDFEQLYYLMKENDWFKTDLIDGEFYLILPQAIEPVNELIPDDKPCNDITDFRVLVNLYTPPLDAWDEIKLYWNSNDIWFPETTNEQFEQVKTYYIRAGKKEDKIR